MQEQNIDSDIWEIPISKLIPMLKLMRDELTEHFKKGGRVKVTNPDGFPLQELLSNFTFDNWKE